MLRKRNRGLWVTAMRGKENIIAAALGIIPVVWLALLTAPFLGGGLAGIVSGLPGALSAPLDLNICGDSVKTVLIFLCAYLMGIGIYLSTRRNYRRGEEMGSAVWGDAVKLNNTIPWQML